MCLKARIYYLLHCAWRKRYLIVVPILFMPIVGALVSHTSDKKYSSHTSMLVQETAKMNPFLEDLAVSSMLKHRMAALETLLHSRYILGVVARERGLVALDSSDAELERSVRNLSKGLRIMMVGKDLIRIDYTASSPEGMKETLESVSKHFIEQLLAPERSSINDSSEFLLEHIELKRYELEEAELALANFKDAHVNVLPELHVNNITRLNGVRKTLSEKKAKLAGLKRSIGSIDQQLSKSNPVLGRLEEKIVDLESGLTLLRAKYTDEHSRVVASIRTLNRLKEERELVIKTTRDSIDSDKLWDIASQYNVNADGSGKTLLISQLENLQSARSEIEGLEAEVKFLLETKNDIEQSVSKFGQQEHQLTRLQRDLNVKNDLYEDLLKRYEMAQVTGSLSKFEESKRVKIIDRAYTPITPNNLPLFLFVIAGAISGMLIGTGLATLANLADSGLRLTDDLETILGCPVLTRLTEDKYVGV